MSHATARVYALTCRPLAKSQLCCGANFTLRSRQARPDNVPVFCVPVFCGARA